MKIVKYLFLLSAAAVLAGPIEDLQPGQWYEIPNSKLNDCPERATQAEFPWLTHQFNSIMDTWCGGAFDTKRDRLYVGPGGGHASYNGNEVYAFDLADLQWHRITDPDPVLPGQSECTADSVPFAMHTYDGVEYMPNIDRYVVVGGWCTPGTFALNLTTGRWEKSNDPGAGRTGDISAYDPVDGLMYYCGGSSGTFVSWNGTAADWTVRATYTKTWNYYTTATFDYKHRKMLALGRGATLQWTIGDGGAVTYDTLHTTGVTSIEDANNPGFQYDPISDRCIAWYGGRDIYTLDVDTRVWTRFTGTGADPGLPNGRGTYGRFRYVPSKNVFILVNRTSDNVFIYKHADPDTTPASAPSGLQAAAQSYQEVSLSWQASADAESGVLVYYVYRDNVKIGETASTSFKDTTVTELTAYDYQVSAINGGFLESAKSNTASATTPADAISPAIVEVKTTGDSTKVIVVFNEPVNQASAENTGNYGIDNTVSVTSASLGSDLMTVILTTSPLTAGSAYELTVNNVTDRAQAANAVAADTKASFRFDKAVFAVNCGGTEYLTADGTLFKADSAFSGGGAANSSNGVANTEDDPLYQAERYGNFAYNISLANGTYAVTLKFNEIYYSGTGQRVLNVSAEGSAVVTNLDLVDRVGKDVAYDTTVIVNVSDGTLNLAFSASAGGATIGGILVKPGGGSGATQRNNLPFHSFTGLQVWPNPFYQRVAVVVPKKQVTTLKVFDIAGRQVANLKENLRNGRVLWHADVPAGIYIVKAEWKNSRRLSRRIMLIK